MPDLPRHPRHSALPFGPAGARRDRSEAAPRRVPAALRLGASLVLALALVGCRPEAPPAASPSTASPSTGTTAHSPTSPAEGSAVPPGAEASASAETEAPASTLPDGPLDPEALRAGLDTLCQVTRARLGAVGDFSMQERAAQIRETFRTSEHFAVVDRFLTEHVEPGPPTSQYRRIRHGAATLGVEGFECPAMEQLLVRAFFESSRNYTGPEQSGAETVAVFCEAAGLPDVVAAEDPAEKRRRWGRASRERLTGLRSNLFLDALGRVPTGERYERVRAFAAEHGVDDWSCPALEPVLRIPGRFDAPAPDEAPAAE